MYKRNFATAIFLTLVSLPLAAQQAQIPTLQVCNQTEIKGTPTVKISSRADINHSGVFKVKISLKCDSTIYPTGGFELFIDMSDSIAQGTVVSTTVDQVTTTGKHSPTAYLSGRCDAPNVTGCRYWMTFADNKPLVGTGTPDVVGFLILDGAGNRVAYGTGPVVDGDVDVAATSN